MSVKPNHARIYRQVPEFLRECREAADLTQRALAEKLGRPQWWVHRAETGSRRVDVAEFVEWCRGCEIDPHSALDEIIALGGQPKPRRKRGR